MKQSKSGVVFCVLVSACLLFSSCGERGVSSSSAVPAKTQAELFDEFLQEEFLDYVTSSTILQNRLLEDPAKFGVKDRPAAWGSYGAYPTAEEIDRGRRAIRTFGTFDRARLQPEQRDSYDIYAYNAALFEPSLELFYYNEPLEISNGAHVMLPLLLSEYAFSDAGDVGDYLTLCETAGGVFDALIDFEREKSARGLFMSDAAAEDVAAGCESLMKNKTDHFLLTGFDRRIDALNIDGARKSAFKARSKAAFETVLVPAYERLAAAVRALKGTGKNTGGLARFEKGKEYYRLGLKLMGADRTPEELITAFDRAIADMTGETKKLAAAHPDALKKLEKAALPKLTPEKAVEFWMQRSAADFPALPDGVTWRLSAIDESVQDRVAPAFYLVPKLDDYRENIIYYNAARQRAAPEDMLLTFAHEAYPGHMLQKVSLAAGELPDYRRATGFDAYTEGWAHYADVYVCRYLDLEEPIKRLMQLDRTFGYAMMFRADLGVNYEGWTLVQLTDYLKKNYPGAAQAKQTFFKSYYDYAVKNPLRIAPYAVGRYEVDALKAHYQAQLGNAFSDKLFHTEFLKRGEAPFSLIRKWLDGAVPAQVYRFAERRNELLRRAS